MINNHDLLNEYQAARESGDSTAKAADSLTGKIIAIVQERKLCALLDDRAMNLELAVYEYLRDSKAAAGPWRDLYLARKADKAEAERNG